MSEAVWTAAGWTMIHHLWIGTAIACAAGLVRRIAGRIDAEDAYRSSLVCLFVLAVAPVAIFVRMLPASAGRSPNVVGPRNSTTASGAASASAPFAGLAPADVESRVGPPAARPTSGFVGRLPWFWVVGGSWRLARLGLGLEGVRRLRRRALAGVDADLTARAKAAARAVGVARDVAVAFTDGVAGPAVVGVFRPLILLPTAAFGVWTPERFEVALLHELAHVRRWDNLVNLLQHLIEAIFFYHPALWLVSRRVRADRERCCDGIVVAHTGRPADYARALFELARPAPRGGLAFGDGSLISRIRHVLDLERTDMRPKPTRFAPASSAMIPLLTAALAVAAFSTLRAERNGPAAPDRRELTRVIVANAAAGVAPDSTDGTTLRLIAELQCRLGDRAAADRSFREARRAAERSTDRTAAAWALLNVAEIQVRAGDKSAALETLRATATPPPSASSFGWAAHVARLYATLGAGEDLRRLVREADRRHASTKQDPKREPSRLPALVAIHAAAGDWDAAFTLARGDGALQPDDRGQALASIARHLPADPAAERAVTERLLAELETIPEPRHRLGGFVELAAAKTKRGDFSAATDFVNRAPVGPPPQRPFAEKVRIHLLCEISRGRFREGDAAGARRTLDDAFAIALSLPDRADLRRGPFLEIAQVRLLVGDENGAERCVEALSHGERYPLLARLADVRRIRRNPAAPATYRLALADAEFARTHPSTPFSFAVPPGMTDAERARRAAESRTAETALISVEIARIQASLGEVDQARLTAGGIAGEWRQVAYVKVADALAEAGDVAGALAWLRGFQDAKFDRVGVLASHLSVLNDAVVVD